VRSGGQCRFAVADLDTLVGVAAAERLGRREALYLRISGRGDQRSSLAVQEAELRATARSPSVRVFQDVGSGLAERRRGLSRMLDAVARGEVEVVRVTHRDRLARFGTLYLERFFAQNNCQLEVLHAQAGTSQDELLTDFMALVASFAGRLYGLRSAATKRRLLECAQQAVEQ
jgi:predicted site-specific integrase-resolvase